MVPGVTRCFDARRACTDDQTQNLHEHGYASSRAHGRVRSPRMHGVAETHVLRVYGEETAVEREAWYQESSA